eukprot:COSAG02_NODE_906_length_16039_cov_4.410289_15_plen_86_part_00
MKANSVAHCTHCLKVRCLTNAGPTCSSLLLLQLIVVLASCFLAHSFCALLLLSRTLLLVAPALVRPDRSQCESARRESKASLLVS